MSHDELQVTSAVVCQNWQKSTRLADYCSIFTAELHAIKMALVFIQRAKKPQRLLVWITVSFEFPN